MNWIALEVLVLAHQRELRDEAERQHQAQLIVRVRPPFRWPWRRVPAPAPIPPCVPC